MASENNFAYSNTTPVAPPGMVLATVQASGGDPQSISWAVPAMGGVNPQTGTNYEINNSDREMLVTFSNTNPISVTFSATSPATIPPKFRCAIVNLGAGTITLSTGSPATGTINGFPTITLTTGQGGWLFFDGTNWIALSVALL